MANSAPPAKVLAGALSNLVHSARLDVSDNGTATFAPVNTQTHTASFTDAGTMPVNSLTVSGRTTSLPGSLGALRFEYQGAGVQKFSPDGKPGAATYSKFDVKLIEHIGAKDVLLGIGHLVPGGGHLHVGADGGVTAEYKVTSPLGAGGTVDIKVSHVPSELTSPSPGVLHVSGGHNQAIFHVPTA